MEKSLNRRDDHGQTQTLFVTRNDHLEAVVHFQAVSDEELSIDVLAGNPKNLPESRSTEKVYGAGPKAVFAVVEYAIEHGFKKISLATLFNSKPFYEKFGFKECRRISETISVMEMGEDDIRECHAKKADREFLEDLCNLEQGYGVCAQSTLADSSVTGRLLTSHADIHELKLSEGPLSVLRREGIITLSSLATLRLRELSAMIGLSDPDIREIMGRLHTYALELVDQPKKWN